jgi:hypothetical protein
MKAIAYGVGASSDFTKPETLGQCRNYGGGWKEAEHVLAMRRSVERLGGRFTAAQLLQDLLRFEDKRKVQSWVANAHLGSQVARWRDSGEVVLSDPVKRVYAATPRWKGGAK